MCELSAQIEVARSRDLRFLSITDQWDPSESQQFLRGIKYCCLTAWIHNRSLTHSLTNSLTHA